MPLVYVGFAVLLVGGGLDLIATRQLWAIATEGQLHVGGLCNRNLTAFAAELPVLLQSVELEGYSYNCLNAKTDFIFPK